MVVLGATGSIGRSTLNVIRRHPERFRVVGLTAGRRAVELDGLAMEFEPDFVVLAESPPARFRPRWRGEWRRGDDAVAEAAVEGGASIVVNGLVGIAGLPPTLRALEAGRRLALANKESLVAGGELVLEARRRGGAELIPVDSEHSAIHQCLAGRSASEVHRLILTASGGPFRTTPGAEFARIRPADALAHPTWSMGDKISVDSATLANKALEVIEAHILFGVEYDRIEVVVHPASIVHSFVELRDGSTLAQLGYPTMELPIRYALSEPERLADEFRPFDPVAVSPLTFERLRTEDFPMFNLGIAAGRAGGTHPATYSAANEVAVRAFLDGRVSFPEIAGIVARALERLPPRPLSGLEDVWEADRAARRIALQSVEQTAMARNLPRAGG